MRVTPIYYTGMGMDASFAAALMIFTKNTRLKMASDGLDAIRKWPEERMDVELAYMANTIRSSWEFCDYVFLLEDVTLAFTQQLLRTRHGSYAQQTMQVLQVDATNVEPPRGEWYEAGVDPAALSNTRAADMRMLWDATVRAIGSSYEQLIGLGATVEEARGLLPRNIRTNIVVKFNLRTLVEVLHSRISPRNLGEYRDVAVAMRSRVLEVHPWAHHFVDQTRDRVLAMMDEELAALRDSDPGRATRMLKLVDQIRRG